MEAKKAYLIGEESYTLRYSIGRIEQAEREIGGSVLEITANLAQKKMPQVGVVKALFAYGLINGGGVYAPLRKAMEFAEKELQENGYVEMAAAVFDQIAEDCDFLFR